MLQVILMNLLAIVADEKLRQRIADLFKTTPAVSQSGGMTLDMGNGPIIVCTGLPSLADERRIRGELKALDSKAKLSRTKNVTVRCQQYEIAADAKEWQRMFGPEAKAAEKQQRAEKDKKDPSPDEIAKRAEVERKNRQPVVSGK